MRAVGALLLGLIKTLISMWELLTNWAYTILTQPASKLDDYRRTLAAPKEQIKEKDTEVGAFICAQIFYNLGGLVTHTQGLLCHYEGRTNKRMNGQKFTFMLIDTFFRSPTFRKRAIRRS